MGQLDGKMAIVTGAGTGIGKGIARAFAREGADLTIASRNRENLETSAEELRSLGAQVLVVQADLTDEGQILELFRQAMEGFGRVDLLVNNSGIFKGGPIDEIALEDWQDVVDINLTAVFLCSREAMKIMKRQGGGRIINIGSISAQMPRMGSAPYTATKFGLVGLTKSTALEGPRVRRVRGVPAPGQRERRVAGGEQRRHAPGADDDAGRAGDCCAGYGGDASTRQRLGVDRASGWAGVPGAGVIPAGRLGCLGPPGFKQG